MRFKVDFFFLKKKRNTAGFFILLNLGIVRPIGLQYYCKESETRSVDCTSDIPEDAGETSIDLPLQLKLS